MVAAQEAIVDSPEPIANTPDPVVALNLNDAPMPLTRAPEPMDDTDDLTLGTVEPIAPTNGLADNGNKLFIGGDAILSPNLVSDPALRLSQATEVGASKVNTIGLGAPPQ